MTNEFTELNYPVSVQLSNKCFSMVFSQSVDTSAHVFRFLRNNFYIRFIEATKLQYAAIKHNRLTSDELLSNDR